MMATADPAPWARNPRLVKLFDYWSGKRRDGGVPLRADIDPLDIPTLLPWILLVEFAHAEGRMRMRPRVVGTQYATMVGSDCTGQFLDEAFDPEVSDRIVATYREMIATRQPHFWRSSLNAPGREHVDYERLACPLSSDGTAVDMAIAVFSFDAPR